MRPHVHRVRLSACMAEAERGKLAGQGLPLRELEQRDLQVGQFLAFTKRISPNEA